MNTGRFAGYYIVVILYPDTKVAFSATSSIVDVDGVPRRKFRKDLIRVGTYVKDAADLEFQVTRDTLDHWVARFVEMKENGVRVPIPNTHKSAGDADQNRGYVDDIFIDGDTLVMACEMIGEDGIEAAAKSDVSIYSPEEIVDGKGIRYERPIEHVALCTDPVVPGLGEFIPLAASLRVKEQEMDLEKIKKALGIKEDLTVDNVEELILSKHDAMVGELKKLSDEFTAFKASATKEITKPDEALVSLSADNRRMKLEGLVEAAKITPAVRDKLVKIFVDTEPLTLALSNGTAKQFDSIFEALKDNDPVKLKEQTGRQVELSSGMEPKANPLMVDAERRAKDAK